MPKRILDGDGLWRSDRLAEAQPAWIKAEYANLLPLALANGSFEASARRIWSTVYSFNRPEVTLEMVEQILAELERVKLLFRWSDDVTGKNWGYWVGIDKPGRLPSPSRQAKKHETIGTVPPAKQLQHFLLSNGQSMVSHSIANGEVGFGLGFGLGFGIKASSEEKAPSDVRAISKSEPRAEQKLDAPLQEVWSTYIQSTGRNPKTYEFTEKRRKVGMARLKECLRKTEGDLSEAVGLMKRAISGLAASDWHMGLDPKNLGKRFCEWEGHLFRNYEQMERWWNQANAQKSGKMVACSLSPAEIRKQREAIQ